MQENLKAIAIYCGSNMGSDLAYRLMAEEMAATLVNAELTLIYGGARVGLMGAIANTVLRLGGKVIGVIPQSLVDYEVAHDKLTDLHIVNTMHERKALISTLADGFIMLPGGPGSLEEFFEIITWAKLGYHQKPCGILNTNNYFDLIIKFLDHMVNEKFFQANYRDMILIDESPQKLLQKFCKYKAPVVSAWIDEHTSID